MWDFPILPQQASNVSGEVDALYFTIWALTIFFSVLVGALLVFLAAKYRRGSKADRSNAVDHDIRIELAWSIPPLLIGLGVFVWAARLYARL